MSSDLGLPVGSIAHHRQARSLAAKKTTATTTLVGSTVTEAAATYPIGRKWCEDYWWQLIVDGLVKCLCLIISDEIVIGLGGVLDLRFDVRAVINLGVVT